MKRFNTWLLVYMIFILSTSLFSCKIIEDSEFAEELITWIEWNNTGIDSTIYYVSIDGDDKHDGKSEDSAFETLEQALKTVHSGGTVRILPGEYVEAIGLLNCKANQEIIIDHI